MRDEYETRGLYDLIHWMNYSFDTSKAKMVELGSYAGQSTCIFAKYFEKVTAVDPWEDFEEYPSAQNSLSFLIRFNKFSSCIKSSITII